MVTHSDPERQSDTSEERPTVEPLAASPTPACNATTSAECQVPVARRQVEIVNALGFHLRPADKFVRVAYPFSSEIKVEVRGRVCNGKSILDLMTLAAECGTLIDLEARGPDAEAALAALAGLVAARFHEDDEGNPVQVSAP